MPPENLVSSSLKKAQILRKLSLRWSRQPTPCFLEKDELINVDRHDQRFECGMAVRLKTEDPMLGRKDDAREPLNIGDVVGRRYVAADLDMVVVPLQESLLVEVECLLSTVGRDILWKADFHAAPAFAVFLPRFDFFGLNAGSGKEKRSAQIRPHRASHEVGELQIGPRGLQSVSLERRPGLKEFFNDFTVRVLQRDPLRFKAGPSILRAEGPVRNLLVAKVDFDRHVTKDARFTL